MPFGKAKMTGDRISENRHILLSAGGSDDRPVNQMVQENNDI